MLREITKRFAAIGDELSPPKPKPAPPKAAPPLPRYPVTVQASSIEQAQRLIAQAMEMGNPKLVDAARRRLDEICREAMRRSDDVRRMVLKEFGPGLPVDVIDGIVQAEIEYDKAMETMNIAQGKWWGERLAYIREQARKQWMLASPMGVPMTPSLVEFIDNVNWAQKKVADVTGIKQVQEMDYVNDCLVVRKMYADGNVAVQRITRAEMIDTKSALCGRCGQPKFCDDGKTYHLCVVNRG